jgi:hypothetical protein
VIGGDGGFTAIDFLNPVVRYGETQWKVDGAFSGPRRSDGAGFSRKVNGIDLSERALFIPPLVMDPVNPGRLYFGTVTLYRTDDQAENWTAISPASSGRISAIAPSASNSEVVYMGTNRGLAQLTTNGGESWNQITVGLPNRFIKDIAVDPANWQSAFLTVSGFGSGHVFSTADGGTSWQDVSSNLPDIPVNAVVLDPAEPNTVFIGTDLGVFMSTDAGGSWTVMNDGLPNVAVFDLTYNPSTGVLMAATHGRGLFSLTLDRALTLAVLPGARVDSELIGNPEPLHDSATVVLTGVNSTVTQWAAANNAPWLTLTTAEGTGTARLRWTRDLTGLGPGTFVDTIRVSAPGALDSPFEVVDTLVVMAPRTMTVDPIRRSHTAAVGSTTPILDTAAVSITGPDANQAIWEATHGDAPWLTINTPRLFGSGTLRWTKDPTALAEGIYVDTIRITSVGALGTPTLILDSLVMDTPLVGLDPTNRSAHAVSGSADVVPDSARVLLSGGGGGAAQWTATSDSPWLTLTTTSGSGDGMVRWVRNPAGLALGTFTGTISVESTNGGQAILTDTFTLTAPFVPTGCAAQHLLGAACLSDMQLRFLDLEGNGDGAYNLGDFLAQLARQGSGEAPGGGS